MSTVLHIRPDYGILIPVPGAVEVKVYEISGFESHFFNYSYSKNNKAGG